MKLAELGFAPTLNDIKEIVTDYVNINEIEKAQQIFNFIGLKGCPDKDWLSGFMRRENLSLKTATKLSKPHQNITMNPFLINDWFHILEETVKDLVLEDRPDLIWNVATFNNISRKGSSNHLATISKTHPQVLSLDLCKRFRMDEIRHIF